MAERALILISNSACRPTTGLLNHREFSQRLADGNPFRSLKIARLDFGWARRREPLRLGSCEACLVINKLWRQLDVKLARRALGSTFVANLNEPVIGRAVRSAPVVSATQATEKRHSSLPFD